MEQSTSLTMHTMVSLEHPYIHSVLAEEPVQEVVIATGDAPNDPASKLLRADSLWQVGKADCAVALLCDLESLEPQEGWSNEYQAFASGIRKLANGSLDEAYADFVSAMSSNGDSVPLTVFAGHRAVNIAFWMACTGKMLDAASLLDPHVEEQPFAGGILAFAQHMAGDSNLAEKTARQAIEKGFDDPWTLHAVAHSLYSLGRVEECAAWLQEHRAASKGCSTFMRTHMEFHLALAFIDLKDESSLSALIAGPLWGGLPEEEKKDYWAATGVLAVLWKAELRGLKVLGDSTIAAEVLRILEVEGALVSKSQGDPEHPDTTSCLLAMS